MKKLLLVFLLCISYGGVIAQQSISGQVSSAVDGEKLPGVSIIVKGTTIGTTTDIDGNYLLSVPEDAETLVFSFIGYKTKEAPIGNRSVINLELDEDVRSLEEVVVVGYGTSTKKELTGAVSILNGEEVMSLNPTRIEQALQGQVAGVNISTASGSPGGALNIRVRGLSTNGDNAPLILVDGIPFDEEGLNSLNPDDIESINVLKDATAGIYGVRATNGVVIITTKQGKKNQKAAISLNSYYGVQETTKELDLLSAREYAVLKNEAYAAANQTPPFENYDLGEGTDWQDEIFRQAPIQSHNINIMGGTEKSTYSIGGSYLDQEGIVGGDKSGYKRYNARVNFTTDLGSKVLLENVLLYTNENRKTLPENGIGSVLYNTINASPLRNVRNEDGSFTYLEEFSDIINPLAQISNSFNDEKVNKLVGKQEFVYEINDDFKVTARAGYNYANVIRKSFNPLVYYGSGKAQNSVSNPQLVPDSLLLFSETIDSVLVDGVYQEKNVEYKVPIHNNVAETQQIFFNYTLEAFLNYNKTFNSIHNVKATLGISYNGDRGESVTSTAYNIPYNLNSFADISAAEGANLLNNTSSYQYRSRLQSYFLRAEYNFKGKYLLSALIRRDASSRFGENNRFGYFPAVSAAWIASDEAFFNVGLIEFLKVRASYGASGNDKIPLFIYRGLLDGEGVYPFNGQLVNGIAVGTMGNKDLKWESTNQANFGVDLGMFNNKLNISADYFIKTTYDLLFQPDISGIVGSYGAGGRPPYVNAGNVRNKGFEFLVDYNTNIGRDLEFNVTYNFTTIDNEVIEMADGVEFIESASFGVGGGYATRMQKGFPIGYFFGYETEGVYQTPEEIESREVTQDGAKPGDLRYVDQNGDGVVNFGDDSDKTFIGSAIPDMTMGLNLGLKYKGIDVSANIYSSIGNEILRNYERQQPLANLLAYRIDRWTGPGSTNEHPRLTNETNHNNVISDYFVEDGSYVRIKNIQLGYAFPARLMERIGATGLRIYVAVNNLYTFTNYQGYDPGLSGENPDPNDPGTGNPSYAGIDNGFYPQAKTYMVGLNLNF